MRWIHILSVAFAVVVSARSMAGAQQNLLPDADFAKTRPATVKKSEQARRHGPNTLWKWYVIEAELNITYNDGFVEAPGGKVFLHSADFDVEPGKIYEVTFAATGDGGVSAEILWWQRDERGIRAMASPHRTHMEKPTTADRD